MENFIGTTLTFFCKKANKHKHSLQLNKFQLIYLNRTWKNFWNKGLIQTRSDCEKKRLSAAQHCFALNLLLPPHAPPPPNKKKKKTVSNGTTHLQLQPCIAAFFVWNYSTYFLDRTTKSPILNLGLPEGVGPADTFLNIYQVKLKRKIWKYFYQSHLLIKICYKSRQSYKFRHLCFLQITTALKITNYQPGVDPAGGVVQLYDGLGG